MILAPVRAAKDLIPIATSSILGFCVLPSRCFPTLSLGTVGMAAQADLFCATFAGVEESGIAELVSEGLGLLSLGRLAGRGFRMSSDSSSTSRCLLATAFLLAASRRRRCVISLQSL